MALTERKEESKKKIRKGGREGGRKEKTVLNYHI